MRKFVIAIGTAVILGIGIAVGFGLDSDSMPALTQQPTSNPEPATILNAINLMKPGFNGPMSDAERQLHAQLTSKGYYYWVTYDNGTERINHDFTEKGKIKSVEFAIAPSGLRMDATRFGLSTETWSATCAASVGRSPIDSLTTLMSRVNRAASKLNADPTCKYNQLN